jgi:hypothetical protein
VPQLEIVVEGGVPGEVPTVTVDGHALNPALIGVASPINPGKHDLVATTPSGSNASGNVELAEGETKQVRLTLSASGGALSAETKATPGDAAKPRGSAQRLWGFVALGVGAAGVGTGIVTGLMATSKHSSAKSGCPGSVCVAGSQGESDLEAFRTLRTVSTIGYIVGGVGAAAGVTLLILAPKTPAGQSAAGGDRTGTGQSGAASNRTRTGQSTANLQLIVTPVSVGVSGAF